MGVHAYKGLFNPITDAVKIAGNFNGWNNGSDILTDPDDDTIYTITKTFTLGDTLIFKFIKGTDGWEQDPNREYIVPPGYATFSDYFNRDDSYRLLSPVQITFACNMEVEISSGRFNPTSDTLSLRGSFNGWSDQWIMSPSTNPAFYEITKIFTTYVGEVYNYKFAYKTSSDTTWEIDPNKTFTIGNTHISAGKAYIMRVFNDIIHLFPHNPFTIKFTVNMNGALSAINQQPFTKVADVRVCGYIYNTYCWWPFGCWPGEGWPDADSLETTKLYDDGTNGDVTPGDNIWSRNVHYPNFPYLSIEYKYGANWGLTTNNGGNDNESINEIHLLHFTQNIISGTVVNIFGIMGQHQLTTVVVGDIEAGSPTLISSYSLEQNYPNPLNPTTKIRYAIPLLRGDERGVSVSVRIYDILGNEVTTLVDEYKPAGSYEVEFNATSGKRNLASGIYFYQMRVNDPPSSSGQVFIQTRKMILLKIVPNVPS